MKRVNTVVEGQLIFLECIDQHSSVGGDARKVPELSLRLVGNK